MDEDDIPEGIRELGYVELEQYCKDLYIKIANGEVQKPDWLNKAERYERNYNLPETTLTILPKAPEYQKLADLISKFLYSTQHEASYDG